MEKINIEALSGFPEWLPSQKLLEKSYINQITEVFESFGFTPLETAAVERDEVLSSKGEINKQIYSLFRPNVESVNEKNTGLSLHFDLTVPLARYVAANYSNLAFPFKRYQIQKVWRGERAQKGRFREFYQCDIDIIGDSNLDLLADAEVASIIYFIFKKLSFGNFKVHISNRKLLLGIFEEFNLTEEDSKKLLDQLDKMERSATGLEAIKNLLAEKIGRNEKILSLFDCLLAADTANKERLSKLQQLDLSSKTYKNGVNEIIDVYTHLINMGCNDADFKIDISIVRGLDYYTGTVYETFLEGHEKGLGSICSGGRYDNLASYFTSKKLPGVGVSIGLTRLLSYIFEQNIVTPAKSTPSHVLIAMLDRKYLKKYIELASFLRDRGLNTEIYIQDAPLDKQSKYAYKKKIDFVIIYGEDEEKGDFVKVRDMRSNSIRSYALATATELLARDIEQSL